MPFGNSGKLSRRDKMRIARRFNAGTRPTAERVPQGRSNPAPGTDFFSRPCGTCGDKLSPPRSERGRLVPATRVKIFFTRLKSHVAATGLGGTVALRQRRNPDRRPNYFSRPCGTRNLQTPYPALKRRAIFAKSLRDCFGPLCLSYS